MEDRLARVEQDIARMSEKLDNLTDAVLKQTAANADWQQEVRTSLHGDGGGRRGHSIRIDRLEQNAERQQWWLRAMAAAVIAMLVRTAHTLLQGVAEG